eukprot:366055-Chlamydomonas_euryale.AAC.21
MRQHSGRVARGVDEAALRTGGLHTTAGQHPRCAATGTAERPKRYNRDGRVAQAVQQGRPSGQSSATGTAEWPRRYNRDGQVAQAVEWEQPVAPAVQRGQLGAP